MFFKCRWNVLLSGFCLFLFTIFPLHANAEGRAQDAGSEQVYSGPLPDVISKLTLPAVTNQAGRAECVQLLKGLMAAPHTVHWREGRELQTSWQQVEPGTAIATFKQGRYPQQRLRRGGKHAAIFLRATEAGIYVLDQFAGRMHAAERFIPWHHPRDKSPANNATAYSTVRW